MRSLEARVGGGKGKREERKGKEKKRNEARKETRKEL